MDYVVKTFHGSEADFEKFRQRFDASINLIEDYFNDPYEQIVRSKSYTDQQIAAALILFAYRILRVKRPAKNSADTFDILSQCAKESVENSIKQSGKDPCLKQLS